MKRQQLRNATLNWTFHRDEYEEFVGKVWPAVDAIPGYLNRIEAFFLYQTAKSLRGAIRNVDQPKAESVVEIGSYKGRSAVAIGWGLKNNPNEKFKLFCVDPFFDNKVEKGLREEFLNNISNAGVGDLVTCIADYSCEAVRKWPPHEGVLMLWIDGNHEFEYVRDDFLAWSRFLVPGGIVAFHDWYLIGVREAVIQYLFHQDCFQDVSVIDHDLVAARKIDRWPTRQQRAMKRRVYWALRTGSTNPWIAFLAMAYEFAIGRPFGSLKWFFRNKVNIQSE